MPVDARADSGYARPVPSHPNRNRIRRQPRVVVAPDSFKGCRDAGTVAAALAAGITRTRPELAVIERGLADGGEGSLDCLARANPDAAVHRATIAAIHGRPIAARWLQLVDGAAVIESAEVLGLPLIDRRAPALMQRGSAALGELIRAVLDAGANSITVALGGSACNDAGLGLLLALGAQALDAAGNPVSAAPAGLCALASFDTGGLDRRLRGLPITALCDVDNPLCGPAGATRVYGPQKGLAAADIDAVEAAFQRFAAIAGASLVNRAGAGAAGGLGFALATLGAELSPGAAALLALTDVPQLLSGACAVVTGEGRADGQTLRGKLPAAVAALAGDAGVPAYLVAGSVAPQARRELENRFAGVLALAELAGSSEAAMVEPERWLIAAGEQLARQLPTAAAGRR